jgi:hypothetical protein
MGLLWWLATLPLRVVLGLVTFAVVLVLGLIGQGGRDDADADRGRWSLQRGNHPDTHLVTPAIGRRGWAKR